MTNLRLDFDRDQKLTVLCLGAHSDDIEIGCGGTILQLIRRYPQCRIQWVVFSAIGERKKEAEKGAELFAGPNHLERIDLKEFRDGFMPYDGAEVKEAFEEFKKYTPPDLIFTHARNDAHQDHRLLWELTWNTFRNHLVLEYEIPKFDGDMGQPNVYVPLEQRECEAKVSNLMTAFRTQCSKRWFKESTFMSLMRLRGMECNSSSDYAEAFYGRKLIF